MAVGNQRRKECIIGGLVPDRVGMALKLRGDAIAQVSAELRPGRHCVLDGRAVGRRVAEGDDDARPAGPGNQLRRAGPLRRQCQEDDSPPRRVLELVEKVNVGIAKGIGPMSPPIALAVRQERPLQVDAQYLPGRLRIRFARRRDGAHAVQHLPRRCRDQGRTEAGCAQRPLGADDRHDVLDRQLRAGKRVPPSAVKLDVPKCRADPIVIRAPLRRAIARADRRDDPVPDLDLDPARRLEVSRNNHHGLFTRSGRANGSHSRHAVATVVSGWAHARLVSLRCSAAPTKSRKSGWALVGLD